MSVSKSDNDHKKDKGTRSNIKETPFLPILGNPFLNELFNNSNIASNAEVKNIINLLCSSPEQYIVLVPETKFMLLAIDDDSGKTYRQLCSNANFLKSHIINVSLSGGPKHKTTNPVNGELLTLNNKTVYIRKGILRNINGFKHDFTLKIIRQTFFRSFATYIPFGACFHIMYIEQSVEGNPRYPGIHHARPKIVPVQKSKSIFLLPLDDTSNEHSIYSFHEVLSQMPKLASTVGKLFKDLFSSFTVREASSNDDLNECFTNVMSKGGSIISNLPESTHNDIKAKFPSISLQHSVFDYIEENIYDRFWAKFLELNESEKDSEIEDAYEYIDSLSITQSGVPEDWIYNPKKLQYLEKRVLNAISVFKRLQFACSSSQQCEILYSTFTVLTGSNTKDISDLDLPSVDADTLMSLLIVVIAHSKVRFLNRRLKYIKLFCYSEENIETGPRGYAISSMEAVISYYSDSLNLKRLKDYSLKNMNLWHLIKAVSSDKNVENLERNDPSHDKILINKITKLLDPFKSPEAAYKIPVDSFIRSRTLNGESCLMLSLLRNNYLLIKTIFDYRYIFTLDDILEDQTVSGTTLLSVALQIENPISGELSFTILQAHDFEIEKYCNIKDTKGRNIGHFLFHNYKLIPILGHYINWEDRDNIGRTPLFSIVRCYDHQSYTEMLKTTLQIVRNWYASHDLRFDFRKHMDNRDNTLVHIMKDGTSLHAYLKMFPCLDLNHFNAGKQTPLMQYIRYSRLSCVKQIIMDPRLELLKTDDMYQMNAEDYIKVDRVENVEDGNEKTNRKIMNILDNEITQRFSATVDQCTCSAVRFRFDKSHEMCIYFRYYDKRISNERNDTYIIHSFNSFVKYFRLMKMLFPETYIGDNDLWFPAYMKTQDMANVNYSRKLRLNVLMLHVNILLTFVRFNSTLRSSPLSTEYLSVQRALDEVPYLRCKTRVQTEALQASLTSDNPRTYILHPENVGNYNAFLKISKVSLKKLSKMMDKFYRLVTFSSTKEEDVIYFEKNIEYLASRSVKKDAITKNLDCIPVQLLSLLSSQKQYISGAHRAVDDVLFAECWKLMKASILEMLKRIDNFLETKLQNWWGLFGEIKGIQDELIKIMNSENAKKSNNKDNNHQRKLQGTVIDKVLLEIRMLLGSLSENAIKEIWSKTKFTPGMDGIFESDGGYFSGLVNKRRKEEATMLVEKFGKVKNSICIMNVELKREYEDLCVELNNFYEFRGLLTRFAFKRYAKSHIEVLKLQKEMMLNSLNETQRWSS